MIIALVGFMGTGKSSVGTRLANRLALDFIDLDQLIEEQEERNIPAIFAEEGEGYFRQLESESLQGLLAGEREMVLATGGGVVLSEVNRRILQSKTFPVRLTATPAEIWARIYGKGRPLLESADPVGRILSLLKEREPYYREFTHRVDTVGKNIEEVVEEIVNLIKRNGVDQFAGDQDKDQGAGA